MGYNDIQNVLKAHKKGVIWAKCDLYNFKRHLYNSPILHLIFINKQTITKKIIIKINIKYLNFYTSI